MWPWLSAPISKSDPGSRRPRSAANLVAAAMAASSLITPSFVARADYVAPTSVGPAMDEASRLLWEEGRDAFGRGRYADAARALQRLVDRHAAASGYLEAHLLLGLTRLRLNEIDPAIQALRYFIEAAGWNPEALRARLSLGRAYLRAGKSMEALLVVKEILDHPAKGQPDTARPAPSAVRLEALLIKARAMMARKREVDVDRALSAFESEARRADDVQPLLAEYGVIRMEVKFTGCARLPGSQPISEALALSRMRSRGSCLLEAFEPFREVLRIGDREKQEVALTGLLAAFADFRKASLNPPPLPGSHGRAAARAYRKELSERLMKNYSETVERAKSILVGWKAGAASDGASVYVEKALKSL